MLVERGLVAAGDPDAGAAGGELLGDAEAEAFGAAGDEGDFTWEGGGHG